LNVIFGQGATLNRLILDVLWARIRHGDWNVLYGLLNQTGALFSRVDHSHTWSSHKPELMNTNMTQKMARIAGVFRIVCIQGIVRTLAGCYVSTIDCVQ
jgi:hypothetical protein